jgi:thioesterase domain-containing protein
VRNLLCNLFHERSQKNALRSLAQQYLAPVTRNLGTVILGLLDRRKTKVSMPPEYLIHNAGAGGVMKHFQAVIASAIAACALPALSQAAPQTAPRPSGKVHVYLMRGLLNVFSLGLDSIAARLNQHGIQATAHNHMEATAIADKAIRACRSGSENEIILVGHSLGASAVVEMADRMSAAGVRAGLVVSIDPVTKTTANGYAHRIVNYYISNSVGQTVGRGASFRGSLQNVDIKNDPAQGGHMFLTNSELVQQRVYNDVLAAVAAHASCRIGSGRAATGPTAAGRPPGT